MKKKLLSLLSVGLVLTAAHAQVVKNKIIATPGENQGEELIDVGTKSSIRFNTDIVSKADIDRMNKERHDYLVSQNPNYDAERNAYEQQVQTIIKNQAAQRANSSNQSQVVITLPVVVHVVYYSSTQNISDNQVFSQMQVLNEDFGRTNADASNTPAAFAAVAANTNIQFCLAQRDPNGNATNGIERRQIGSNVAFSTNDNVKHYSSNGLDAWDPTRYLNIWVCNLGSGLLGYGEFPTSSVSQTMGVVILYSGFGSNYTGFGTFSNIQNPYDRGRTTTHEFSHCFNLYHIWGDDGGSCSGSDYCADTPNQGDATTTCYTFPHTDNCTTTGNGIMFENYMDYSYDNCLNLFTNNQSTRMNAVFSTSPYNALTTSNGCQPLTMVANDAGITGITMPTGTLCSGTFTPVVTLKNFGSATLTQCTINYKVDNNAVQTYSWTGSVASNATTTATLPSVTATNGTHTFTCYTSNPNANSDGQPGNDQATNPFTISGTGQTLPFVEGFEGSTFVPTGWTLTNPDGGNTWARTTTAHNTGSASAKMDNWSYQGGNGQKDDMTTPGVNLSTVANPTLKYYRAYTYWTQPLQYSDSLIIDISTNCGQTWTNLVTKGGTQLQTAPPVSSNTVGFTPTAAQWVQDIVSLNAYQSATNASIRFRNVSDYEDNLYLDDINIDNATGIAEGNLVSDVSIYPNPSAGLFNLFVTLKKADDFKVRVFNTLGEVIVSTNYQNSVGGVFGLDLSAQPKGVYFVEVTTSEQTVTKRIVLSR